MNKLVSGSKTPPVTQRTGGGNERKSADSRLVVRALMIMEAVAFSEKPLGINQLAKTTNLNAATAFRIAKTLCNYGWLSQDAEARYYIGPNAYMVGKECNIYNDLVMVSNEPMQALADNVKQPVNLYGINGKNCLLISQVRGDRSFTGLSPTGTVRPIHITAGGKAVLSTYDDKQLDLMLDTFDYYAYTPNSVMDKESLKKQIEQFRKDGYAVENQESNWGCCCVGVPVYNNFGLAFASLSITMITEYVSFTKVYAEKLLDTSRKITEDLKQYRLAKRWDYSFDPSAFE